MSASSQDKLMEVGIATATTLDANYTINDTSITVASTSGWPTATGVAFAIDVVDSAGVQVPGTYNEYVGVVSSATSITSVDHVNGTDRNYSAGATTRVYIPVTAERENRIVEWGTVQHKQDGTHADTITTDTINENTSANGVTIDGLNIKDSKLNTNNSVVTANITDGAVTFAKTSGIWWEEIGRTTLASAGDTIDVTSLPARKYLRLQAVLIASGGNIDCNVTFNSDTGSNYAVRRINLDTSNAVSGGAGASQAHMNIFQASSQNLRQVTIDILNIANQEKLVTAVENASNAAGAANAPIWRTTVGKWANTSAAISSITFTNSQAGDFAIGSEIIVLGRD